MPDRPHVTVRKVDARRWSVEADDGRWVGMERVEEQEAPCERSA